MKKKPFILAALLCICMLLAAPGRKAEAAAYKVKSIDPIYQTSTKVTGKATAGQVVRLKLKGKTYRTKTGKDGDYTFKRVKKAPVGTKATVTVYNKKGKAVHTKSTIVKGDYRFSFAGYNAVTGKMEGKGTAGKKVKIQMGKKNYYTRVGNDGTWEKKFSSPKKSVTVKASQQTTGKKYSKPKSVKVSGTKFNTSLLKEGAKYRQYYSAGYRRNPKTTWVGFQATGIYGNKMYFKYTICEMKNGQGKPQTLAGVGRITGKNTMMFEYMSGITAKFVWKDARTVVVEGKDSIFGYGTRTETLTAA